MNIHENVRELIRSEAARSIFVLRDQDGSSKDEKQIIGRLKEIIRARGREQEAKESNGTAPS